MNFDIAPYEKYIRLWVAAGSGLPLQSCYFGQQDSARRPEPAIEMRVYSTHTLGQAWLDKEANYVVTGSKTIVSAGANAFTSTAHGFTNGDGPVRFASSGTLPGGISAGKNYWIIFVDANTIKVAASYVATGGAFVDGSPSGKTVTPATITSAGTGTITVAGTSTFVRAAAPIRYVSRSMERVAIMLECHTSAGVGMTSAMGILNLIKSRQQLPSMGAILAKGRLGFTDIERSRAIHGVRNAVMFEPRAIMEVYFSAAYEQSEGGQAIETAVVTNQTSGKTFQVTVP